MIFSGIAAKIGFSVIGSFLAPVGKLWRALPGAAKGALVAGAVAFGFWEGVGIPNPWGWDLDIIDGRVDRVREEEQAICQKRIDFSIEQARRIDRDADDFATERHIEEISEQAAQLQQSQERINAYRKERQDLVASGAIGACAATPADVERMRERP